MDLSEAAVEGAFTFTLAFFSVRLINRKSSISEILALSAFPVAIDLDHLLPTYSAGIKAFHSVVFISLVSLGMLAYGYLKKSERMEKIGISVYVAAFLAISIDLLEGGRINFLYPLSGKSYVLSGQTANYPSILLIGLMCLALLTAYFLSFFLGKDKGTVLRADPQTGHTS